MRNINQEKRRRLRGRSYHLWVRDDAGCREAILRGEEVEVVPSAYGENDFFTAEQYCFTVLSFLWEVGYGIT